RHLSEDVSRVVIPDAARPFFRSLGTSRLVDNVVAPTGALTTRRDSVPIQSLSEAVADLTKRFGADPSKWQYGQPEYHYALIAHPLSAAVSAELRRKLDLGPLPRGGDANTVGATGNGGNQTAGASFRIIVDVGDWDRAVGTNTPGQSGNPDSPHYRDLFEMWANDRYFAVPYSRQKVEQAAERREKPQPQKNNKGTRRDPQPPLVER